MATTTEHNKHRETSGLHQVSLGGNDHRAHTEHGKNDVSHLLGLGLRDENVVNQRREDKRNEGDRETSDQRHHTLEVREHDRNEGHQKRHEETQQNALLVLHEVALTFLRYAQGLRSLLHSLMPLSRARMPGNTATGYEK